ncbi:MAG TPA: 2-phosphosulfolactate phosphatase [Candidatus Hydrogenedentes bacterium]|nr:2-phosphosulfolactate phosphatase [Candidatus Hydrogenedentota bacterium]HOS03749.1 2-phosphosulfolactate phosphatase [Candidatus Hydrogenedentota bacterium]
MRIHLIEGEAGCRYAAESGCVAVIVDALRASATAAMLLHAGASRLFVTGDLDAARAARDRLEGALLYGERGGLPPEGFDGGNSPRLLGDVRGKTVVFTTTTGAGRLVASWGAPGVYMGTPLNAQAVIARAQSHGRDVAVIPAGLATDPHFDAQEDWAAAAALVMRMSGDIGHGAGQFAQWRRRIEAEGLDALFHAAPHAEKLRRVGLDDDISYCARFDLTGAVPCAVRREAQGVWVTDGRGMPGEQS